MRWIIVVIIWATGIQSSFCQDQKYDLMVEKLDSLINLAIDSAAFPGAQILVRHKDSVILHRTWGHHTYEFIKEVRKDDLYDLASITKVASGLPLIMKLYGEGRINIDAPLKDYFQVLKNSNKKNLTLRKVLAHQARLEPYIVFWQQALKKNGSYKCRSFKTKYSKKYNIRITDSLYMHKKYHKRMLRAIKKSELATQSLYKYSGLAFLLMPTMITDLVGADFEPYLYEQIYQPIGANQLFYNPMKRNISLDKIIPTEYDSVWRKQLVHGTVHDEAAAMLNGISCNAGLFGNAESLSRLFQLYINGGSWNGEQIILERAVQVFTAYQYEDNRRGLGFDKPLKEYNANQAYVAESASSESYGHSGFTGTMVWADPEHDMVFVFLSNRVYPNRDHRHLYRLSLRPKMHQYIYDYILSKN